MRCTSSAGLPTATLSCAASVEVISKAAVLLMSSAAEKLGLADENPAAGASVDLDEARRLITALAGLVTASVEYLGPHAGPLRDGDKAYIAECLQNANWLTRSLEQRARTVLKSSILAVIGTAPGLVTPRSFREA